MTEAKKKVGDRIKVLANTMLGTTDVMATIRSVEENCYYVHCDGDGAEWTGPVTFNGDVLCDMP